MGAHFEIPRFQTKVRKSFDDDFLMSKLLLCIATVTTVTAYANDKICVSDYDTVENDPASGCYVQSGTWVPGKAVECELRNKACLPVSCTASVLKPSSVPICLTLTRTRHCTADLSITRLF